MIDLLSWFICSSVPPQKSQRRERPEGRGQDFGLEQQGMTAGVSRASITGAEGEDKAQSRAGWRDLLQGATRPV
jgi:hypothetical protein